MQQMVSLQTSSTADFTYSWPVTSLGCLIWEGITSPPCSSLLYSSPFYHLASAHPGVEEGEEAEEEEEGEGVGVVGDGVGASLVGP